MIQIGKFNELEYKRKTVAGLILGNDDQEVLLPFNYAPKNVEPGDTLNVFVYLHSDGRILATTQTPFAVAGEFAYLKVVEVTEIGAFMDLGIDKDVFVPKSEQKRPMRISEKHVVYIYVDKRTDRLLGSSRISNFVEVDEFDVEMGDEVELLIWDQSELGYSAIINQKYMGLLYRNELYEKLEIGETRKGYIKKIREENLIDLTLQPLGYKHILDTKETLLNKLKENEGRLSLGDKSSPDEIYRELKISKKAFKKTSGALYKERLIEISDYEIRLVKENED
jgi:uncharacterized protein